MWRPEDVERLNEIYVQPEYLEHMPPASAAAHIADYQRLWAKDGFSKWAACERGTGYLVGRIGLLRHDDWPLAREPVEVGWVLDRAYWGRGLATEGGRAAVDAWRTYLADETLYSFTVPENARSRAVMVRLDMTFGGTALWHGREHAWYSLARQAGS
ncbi:MAG: family N-acetyltransferase [Thermoleophilia bacterium]|nr:family N-acetyltransferase [Thermoleophilia bacterium]